MFFFRPFFYLFFSSGRIKAYKIYEIFGILRLLFYQCSIFSNCSWQNTNFPQKVKKKYRNVFVNQDHINPLNVLSTPVGTKDTATASMSCTVMSEQTAILLCYVAALAGQETHPYSPIACVITMTTNAVDKQTLTLVQTFGDQVWTIRTNQSGNPESRRHSERERRPEYIHIRSQVQVGHTHVPLCFYCTCSLSLYSDHVSVWGFFLPVCILWKVYFVQETWFVLWSCHWSFSFFRLDTQWEDSLCGVSGQFFELWKPSYSDWFISVCQWVQLFWKQESSWLSVILSLSQAFNSR